MEKGLGTSVLMLAQDVHKLLFFSVSLSNLTPVYGF